MKLQCCVLTSAHSNGHGSEDESFLEHQLSEDVNDVVVLSIDSVLLKLLHVLPVLQRQTDLQPDTQQENLPSGAFHSERVDDAVGTVW